jgi:hypothetical protein
MNAVSAGGREFVCGFVCEFANPAVFPHHYWFVWGRSTLPLQQFFF